MFKDLYSLAFGFELACTLISVGLLWFVRVSQRQFGALLILKSSLPVSLILFSGVVLLTAALGTSELASLQRELSRITPVPGQVMDHPVPALAMVLIVAGVTFRLAVMPLHFLLEKNLRELPCWLISLSGISVVCVVVLFLLPFINTITVVNLRYSEQILYFLGLMILIATAGLLLIERDLKRVLVLMILQLVGVLFAQLSAVCWQWRHATIQNEENSIFDVMKLSGSDYLYSLVAILGLACVLDCVGQARSTEKYPEQIQGLISDQRMLGSVLILLLLFLMGVPGFAMFEIKWQVMQTLLEIHQGSLTGTMAVLHNGYTGLSVILAISSAAVAFVCGKLIMQISFMKPLARYRELSNVRTAIVAYACALSILIFSIGSWFSF